MTNITEYLETSVRLKLINNKLTCTNDGKIIDENGVVYEDVIFAGELPSGDGTLLVISTNPFKKQNVTNEEEHKTTHNNIANVMLHNVPLLTEDQQCENIYTKMSLIP